MDISYRSTGRMAIASGIFGLLAFCFLTWGLVPHWRLAPGDEFPRFRAHDAGVILQFLLIIPVVFKLSELSHKDLHEKNQKTLILGIGALALTVFLVAMIFSKLNITADVLYMIPQGMFGAWLVIVNRRTPEILPVGLRRLGIVAGIGLLIVGLFPILFAVLVDVMILHGEPSEPYSPPPTTANLVIHLMLIFGTLLGVTTYPIWSILVGRKFLRVGAVNSVSTSQ
jgi:hypothetical protein